MLWLDTLYLNYLSGRLRNFKRKSNSSWNFSCPYCGDSKTNNRKARGYVYEKKGVLRYYCHNCNIPGVTIPKLLKYLDTDLYNQYIKEKLVSSPQKTELQVFVEKMKPPVFVTGSPLKHLKKISKFSPDSPIRLWVDKRALPAASHYKLFFCKRFMQWVNEYCIADKFSAEVLVYDEPRLVIPFLDRDKKLFGFQGRSFKKNSDSKYITIILDDTKPKLFGLDTVDVEKPYIYVVEGPLDSLFIDNCIASAGSDLISNIHTVTNDKSKFIIIFDNEPRNREIVNKIEKTIQQGYSVCIWPDSLLAKDINDIALTGKSSQNILDMIHENTYSGAQALLRLYKWKKV